MQELAAEWYALLSRLNAAVADPLHMLADGIGLPFVSAFLFGLMGATSPCQLTTNASALAYVVRDADDRRSVARRALAYVLGKVLVYMVLGIAIILAGRQLAQTSIPAIVVVRKLLGPLMILLGLYVLGVVPLRFSLGQHVARSLEARAGSGARGAFLLGVAFSFAFCPTLFLLFFGLTIPLALHSTMGMVYPGIFALGTALPLLGLSSLVMAGAGALKGYLAGMGRINAWLRPTTAVVLMLAGLNDTVIYWFV